MRSKRWAAAGAGIVISAVFLWIAFRGLHPEAVLTYIRQVNPVWLAAGAGVYFLAVAAISLRWGFLLRAARSLPLRALMPLVSIGYMGNNVYPFRSGEVLRVVLLQHNHQVPLARGMTTVVVERVFDGLVMLSFILISLLFVEISSPEIRSVASVAAPIFLGAVAVFFALAARPNALRWLRAQLDQFLPAGLRKPVSHLVEGVIGGLEGLRTPADLAGAVAFSFLSWGIEASVYWLVSFAFDLNVSYPLMLLVVGVVNLAGLIPASPGQLGVFEFFVALVLVGAGIPQAQANAYALVIHLVIWLPVTLAGFYFLVRQGLGWSAITHARDLEGQPTIESSRSGG